MRNLSLIMFGIALVLATITVMFARSFINNQRTSQVVQVTGPEVEVSTMVVAAGPLQFGDEITVENLKVVPWPKDPETRPEGSFEAISEIMTSDRRVAIRSLAKNEPIIQAKLSGFGYRATLSQVVDHEMRAVAIRVNDVTGVGGFVLPGDRVDVMHTYNTGDDVVDNVTNLIVRDVRVLAIDQIADESTQGAVVAKAATLEVTQKQAAKLSLSSKVGSLDLVLRPMRIDEEISDERADTIKVADLTPDNSLAIETRAKPVVKKRTNRTVRRRVKPVATKKVNPFGNMIITRGVETEDQKVLKEVVVTSQNNQTDISGGYITDLAGASPSPK